MIYLNDIPSAVANIATRVAEMHIPFSVFYLLFLLYIGLFYSPFRQKSRSGSGLVTAAAAGRGRGEWITLFSRSVNVLCVVHIALFHVVPAELAALENAAAQNKQKTSSSQSEVAMQPSSSSLHSGVSPTMLFFPLLSGISSLLFLLQRLKRKLGMRVSYAPTHLALVLNTLLLACALTLHFAVCRAAPVLLAGKGTIGKQTSGSTSSSSSSTSVFSPDALLLRALTHGACPASAETLASYLWPMLQNVFRFFSAHQQEDEPALVVAGVDRHLVAGADDAMWSLSTLATFSWFLCASLVVVASDYMYKRAYGFRVYRGILWADSVEPKPDMNETAANSSSSPSGSSSSSGFPSTTFDDLLLARTSTSVANDAAPQDDTEGHQAATSGHSFAVFEATGARGYGDPLDAFDHVANALAEQHSSENDEHEAKEDEGDDESLLHERVRSLCFGDKKTSSSSSSLLSSLFPQFPVNPLGMVSWFSHSTASTALKLFTTSNLSSFDFRTSERGFGPKVLRILPEEKRHRNRNRNDIDDDDDSGEERTNERSSSSSSDDDDDEPFVFDWVADIGDGFNSTYTIAHALAQPELHVRVPKKPDFAANTVNTVSESKKGKKDNLLRKAQRYARRIGFRVELSRERRHRESRRERRFLRRCRQSLLRDKRHLERLVAAGNGNNNDEADRGGVSSSAATRELKAAENLLKQLTRPSGDSRRRLTALETARKLQKRKKLKKEDTTSSSSGIFASTSFSSDSSSCLSSSGSESESESSSSSGDSTSSFSTSSSSPSSSSSENASTPLHSPSLESSMSVSNAKKNDERQSSSIPRLAAAVPKKLLLNLPKTMKRQALAAAQRGNAKVSSLLSLPSKHARARTKRRLRRRLRKLRGLVLGATKAAVSTVLRGGGENGAALRIRRASASFAAQVSPLLGKTKQTRSETDNTTNTETTMMPRSRTQGSFSDVMRLIGSDSQNNDDDGTNDDSTSSSVSSSSPGSSGSSSSSSNESSLSKLSSFSRSSSAFAACDDGQNHIDDDDESAHNHNEKHRRTVSYSVGDFDESKTTETQKKQQKKKKHTNKSISKMKNKSDKAQHKRPPKSKPDETKHNDRREQQRQRIRDRMTRIVLPRGRLITVGGDLSYPMPSIGAFRDRLFAPYADALPFYSSSEEDEDATSNGTNNNTNTTSKLDSISDLRRRVCFPRPQKLPSKRAVPIRHQNQGADGNVGDDDDDDDDDDVKTLYVASAKAATSSSSKTKKNTNSHRPLFFPFPGNHDYIEHGRCYASTILSFDYFAGYRMPQTSSYFALQLPSNWWFLCLDTGLGVDIDSFQLAYFLHCIEHRILAGSGKEKSSTPPSVILSCHDPFWINDFYEREGQPHTQNRVSSVARALGKHLRLRICGDIHNYSKWEKKKPKQTKKDASVPSPKPGPTAATAASSEDHSPILIVSGGGGAFLHGTEMPRGKELPVYGETYQRTSTYPAPVSRFSWKWVLNFRHLNWKFDVIGVLFYSLLVFSLVPAAPLYREGCTTVCFPSSNGTAAASASSVPTASSSSSSTFDTSGIPLSGIWRFVFHRVMPLTASLIFDKLLGEAYLSCAVALIAVAISFLVQEARLPLKWRLVLGLSHGLAHILTAVGLLAVFVCGTQTLLDLKMVQSQPPAVEVVRLDGMQATTRTTPVVRFELREVAATRGSSLEGLINDGYDRLARIFGQRGRGNGGSGSNDGNDNRNAVVLQLLLDAASTCARSVDIIENFVYWHSSVAFSLERRAAMEEAETMIRNEYGNGKDYEIVIATKEKTTSSLSSSPSRAQWLMLYLHTFFFFYLLAAPAVALVLGSYLCICVSFFGVCWNDAYSAFQIDDGKHFLRFVINNSGKKGKKKTKTTNNRSLSVFVIAFDHVADRWERDERHDEERWQFWKQTRSQKNEAKKTKQKLPASSMQFPSLWRPAADCERDLRTQPKLHDVFTIEATPE